MLELALVLCGTATAAILTRATVTVFATAPQRRR
jgi:hypothetical protein